MYLNKCSKCGAEFETKNPKRVICPGCLYPDRNPVSLKSYSDAIAQPNDSQQEKQQKENDQRTQMNFQPQQRFNNQGSQGGGEFRRPQGPPQGGFRRPGMSPSPKKSLLISKEQVAEIENLYKTMLPLPNPDAHEVIAKEINLEPNKVFFGINLVRQKMRLPKLPYPKKKLAVSSDQLTAIENLYTPLMPLPPIGCHKIIAKQLKMDEWRVHVGIGIIRKQMNLPRWNDREDAPEEFRKPAQVKVEE
ncbi:MAG: hypothetical protein V2B14_05375 [bacterium]